jgi:hypothetical protein
MWNTITDDDPSGQILDTYIANEELRALLALARSRPTRDQISNAKCRFSAWCALFARVPAIVTLAQTSTPGGPRSRRPPAEHQPQHAPGLEQSDQAAQESGCGFANQANHERRILT